MEEELESVELYPAAISAAFHLERIIRRYRHVIVKDNFIAASLYDLAGNLRKASLGDKKALQEVVVGGAAILDIVSQLIKHDAIHEQISEYEYILAILDQDKHAVDSLELHSYLINFKVDFFDKRLYLSTPPVKEERS